MSHCVSLYTTTELERSPGRRWPIILGRRLSTKKTFGAYRFDLQQGRPGVAHVAFHAERSRFRRRKTFFDMMTDFVGRYRNKTASTDDSKVVNEHFAQTPIAKKYGMTDLTGSSEMVYETALSSYELQYQIADQPDGKVLVSGTVIQQNTPADWDGFAAEIPIR
jgi:hypothetical protein